MLLVEGSCGAPLLVVHQLIAGPMRHLQQHAPQHQRAHGLSANLGSEQTEPDEGPDEGPECNCGKAADNIIDLHYSGATAVPGGRGERGSIRD